MSAEVEGFRRTIDELQNQLEKAKKFRPYFEKYQTMKELLEATLGKVREASESKPTHLLSMTNF